MTDKQIPALPSLDSLATVVPKAQSFSGLELVTTRVLNGSGQLPVVVEPRVPEIDAVQWLTNHRAWVDSQLAEYGAVLFRNFKIESASQFDAFARASCRTLIQYAERSSPRTAIHGRVYSSTEHPASQHIVLHCEQSYTLEWPMRILFCCLQPATRGGRTPIAAMRDVTQALPDAVLDEFARRGVCYVRNYGGGMGLTWQEAFQTADRTVAERYCRRMAIEFEWLDENRLRTRQVRPALRRHPTTGDLLWFNHALFFHISSLDPDIRAAIVDGVPEADFPQNTYYGDGAPIAAPVLEQLREAHERATTSFAWEPGDVLLLDNMLVAHGREAFEGPRKIAAALGDPFRAPESATHDA